jgi:hypothetical protein
VSENILRSQVAVIAAKALSAGGEELRAAFVDLRTSAKQHATRAEELAAKAAGFLRAGLAGEIPLDVAREAADREVGALEELALQVQDAGEQQAIRRARRAMSLAVDAGTALAKVALGAALGAL